jgi:hypothetical protein
MCVLRPPSHVHRPIYTVNKFVKEIIFFVKKNWLRVCQLCVVQTPFWRQQPVLYAVILSIHDKQRKGCFHSVPVDHSDPSVALCYVVLALVSSLFLRKTLKTVSDCLQPQNNYLNMILLYCYLFGPNFYFVCISQAMFSTSGRQRMCVCLLTPELPFDTNTTHIAFCYFDVRHGIYFLGIFPFLSNCLTL